MRDKLILEDRPPNNIKTIEDRIREVKHPDYKREYVWDFETQYIGIKADLSGEYDTWLVNIYNSKKDMNNGNEDRRFEDKTLRDAIESAETFVERLNLNKEEYVS